MGRLVRGEGSVRAGEGARLGTGPRPRVGPGDGARLRARREGPPGLLLPAPAEPTSLTATSEVLPDPVLKDKHCNIAEH